VKKLQETGTTAKRNGSIESIGPYRIFLVFLFCNIHTQTGYYKKRISHLFAILLRCNTIKYY